MHRQKLAVAWALCSMGGCAFPSPPQRTSPELLAVGSIDGSADDVDAAHDAWVQDSARESAFWDREGRIAPAPRDRRHADVALDRSAVVCTSEAVCELDGDDSSCTPLAALDARSCFGVASEGRGATWVSVDVGGGSLCTNRSGDWVCIELDGRAIELTLSDTQLWWMTGTDDDADLVTLRLDDVGLLDPSRVLTDVGPSHIVTRAGLDVVLLTRPANAPDPRPHRITFEPTTLRVVDEVLAWEPEESIWESGQPGYVDVWMGRDARVLALDRLRAGNTSCSPGWFGYGGGCSIDWVWTQLILVELTPEGATELGHVDYQGGTQRAFGLAWTETEAVMGDRMYVLDETP